MLLGLLLLTVWCVVVVVITIIMTMSDLADVLRLHVPVLLTPQLQKGLNEPHTLLSSVEQ